MSARTGEGRCDSAAAPCHAVSLRRAGEKRERKGERRAVEPHGRRAGRGQVRRRRRAVPPPPGRAAPSLAKEWLGLGFFAWMFYTFDPRPRPSDWIGRLVMIGPRMAQEGRARGELSRPRPRLRPGGGGVGRGARAKRASTKVHFRSLGAEAKENMFNFAPCFVNV